MYSSDSIFRNARSNSSIRNIGNFSDCGDSCAIMSLVTVVAVISRGSNITVELFNVFKRFNLFSFLNMFTKK